MIHELSSENKKKALRFLKKRMNGKLLTHINSCVHCGLCGESCHYFLTNPILKYLPGYKIEQISKIYKRYFTIPGRWIPKWVGAKDLDPDSITELIDVLYGACTMCGRCSLHCSIGVDIAYLIRTGRSMLAEIGCVPRSLQSTVDAAINTGNNMGIPRNDLVDTLRWLEEELQSEVEDENATIPLDKQNRRILYTLNPREPKFFPLSISAIAKIFYSANEDWTISSHVYDVTNYAYFSGNESEDRELVKRLAEETKKLHAKHLVLAECGHGYRAFRWEGTSLYGRPYPFHVQSVIELIAEYVRSGRIKLDSTKNKNRVTLHDPCNLVRNGGVIDEQRFVLKHAVMDFVEMVPNRENNYCCGGGGGMLSMGEYKDRRIEAGKMKAEQIRKTGAKIVATPCHNCIDQLMELNLEYQLGIKIKTISEIVADAVILNHSS